MKPRTCDPALASHGLPRRAFLTRLTAGATLVSMLKSGAAAGDAGPRGRYSVVVFSKPFQNLAPDACAELVAEAGYHGIECPVRAGGQVLPERVEDDLPKLVEALGKRGCRLEIMATDIRGLDTPHTEKVLRTASRLGIRFYRLGGVRYRPDQPIPDQLAALRDRLKDLIPLNRELNLCAGWQNHSGSEDIGAPVWDVHHLVHDQDLRHLGIFFDIGHATVEGGYAWRTHAQLMEPFWRAIYVKDFTWKKGSRGWGAEWCPLGQGMVNRAFFDRLKRSPFRGPIAQHFEYPLGERQEMVSKMKADLQTLRSWLEA